MFNYRALGIAAPLAFVIGALSVSTLIAANNLQRVRVDYVVPHDLKEWPRLRGSGSAMTLVNRAPNPNAAKVFINW
jgi:ABC-type Fe3+ transport system substrate-binding protein